MSEMLKTAIGTAIGTLAAVGVVVAGIRVWQNLPYHVSEELRAVIEAQCASRVNTTPYLAKTLNFKGYNECVDAGIEWARWHKH